MRLVLIAFSLLFAADFARAESEDQCTDKCYEELGECEYVCQEKIGCQTKCATSKVKCEKQCTKKSSLTDFNIGYVSRNTRAGYSYAWGIRAAASDANLLKSSGSALRVSAKIHESSAELSTTIHAFCTNPAISVVIGGDGLPPDAPLDTCDKPYIQIGDTNGYSKAKAGLRFQFGADIKRQVSFAVDNLSAIASSGSIAVFVPQAYDNKQFLDELSSKAARKGSVLAYAFSVGSNGAVSARQLTSNSGEIRAVIHMARPDASSTFLPPPGTSVSSSAINVIPDDRCQFVSANPPPVCIRPGTDLSSKDGLAFLSRVTSGLQASNFKNDAAFEYAAIGFDLGNVLNSVREKANSSSAASLSKAIQEYSGTGLSGSIAFDSAGIRRTAPVALLQVSKDGLRRMK